LNVRATGSRAWTFANYPQDIHKQIFEVHGAARRKALNDHRAWGCSMRLSGGTLRNRSIRSPRGLAVRPTPGKVKEALYSILAARIVDARVLDLYAGSGAIGFEALSRGAAHVTFVERHAPTAAAIAATAQALGVGERIRVVCAAAERAAERLSGRFGIVYADPPYALPPPHAAFAALLERGALEANALLVYEHRTDAPAFSGAGFVSTREARYGEVTLQFLAVDAKE
jgi:16S rRNA (guanine(966)-N(2))-methyltransferase RsmD